MNVRRRAVPAAFGLFAFVVLGSLAEPKFWTQWWFYVGVLTALAAVVVEPFFTRAQDGLVNSVGAIGAVWSADVENLRGLWQVYLWASIAIFAASLVAVMLPGRSLPKAIANQVATRFGRAVLLGVTALLIESASRLAAGDDAYVFLTVASVVLAVSLSLDVERILAGAGQSPMIRVVDAQSPRLVVVENLSTAVTPGDGLLLGPEGHQVGAAVLSTLASPAGARALLAIDRDWRSVADSYPVEVAAAPDDGDRRLMGLACAGSSPTTVEFEEVRPIEVGEPITLIDSQGRPILYQVFDRRLRDASWSGSKGLVSHAVALQLGQDDRGYLRAQPMLPIPHAELRRPEGTLATALPLGYHRIGVVKGTDYVIGVADDASVRGHLAVLGMSGMGKTTVVDKLCKSLGQTRPVVTLDTTGEYHGRLGYSAWTPLDFSTVGAFVHEPQGDPPAQAKKFIFDFMTQAAADYQAGQSVARVICLEEAHSFVPEWNFATRSQGDDVAFSTRMIMQARKYELAFIIVSQRTAVVSKSALSQCESYIVLRTVDDTSLSYIEGMAGSVVRTVVPSLRRYEALCFGPAFNAETPVVVQLDDPLKPAPSTLTTDG